MNLLHLLQSRGARLAALVAVSSTTMVLWALPVPRQYAKPKEEVPAPTAAPKFSDPRQDALKRWIDPFFPWGDGEITIETRIVSFEGKEVKPQGYKIALVKKAYSGDTRMNDQLFAVLDDDGKSALVGDIFIAEDRVKMPAPVRTEADLSSMKEKLGLFLRGKFQITLNPANDRRGWKALKIKPATGYGPYEIEAYVDTDTGSILLLGRYWDRQKGVVEQRKPLMKLADTPAVGPADAKIIAVEYSDMQCGFCKKRTQDWDTLMARLSSKIKIKRYLKSFPLTEVHPWAFRAASAGRCFFEISPDLFFRWKSNVYAKQEQLTVPDLDTFALDFAAASEVPEKTFSGCYLGQKSIDRVIQDLSEGFAVRVRSTPTYFIDGVYVSWSLDDTLEEFLRKTYLNGEGLPLPKPPATVTPKPEKK